MLSDRQYLVEELLFLRGNCWLLRSLGAIKSRLSCTTENSLFRCDVIKSIFSFFGSFSFPALDVYCKEVDRLHGMGLWK